MAREIISKKDERAARMQERRAQVTRIFRDTLKGRCLNGCKGPQGRSELEFWVVGKTLIVVQLWKDGVGWEYYIQGGEGEESAIVAQLQKLIAD